MSTLRAMIAGSLIALSPLALTAMAESERDCRLKGTVQKASEGDSSQTEVRFHSISRYDENSKCRVRRDQKMEFRLPDDPRLQEAPDGSEVEYRYRSRNGESQIELLSVGT